MRKSKYDIFTRYLRESNKDTITLTYKEMQDILGFMPQSALDYSAPWSDGHGSPFSKSWLKAGYTIINDFKNEKATFKKSVEGKLYKNNIKDMSVYKIQSNSNKKINTLDINVAIEAIRDFARRIVDGNFTRYRSWDHCYKAFQKHWNEKDSKDLLSLHLSWYLASWGMLRGSSFLLSYDYKIHYKVVEKLTNPYFESLFMDTLNPNLSLVMEASNIINSGYGNNKPTDTLITKILLGVFGCTPAYDRYFRNSAVKYDVCKIKFTYESLKDIWEYYNDNLSTLEKIRNELSNKDLTYTPMKLMDMALFQLGLAASNKAIKLSNK